MSSTACSCVAHFGQHGDDFEWIIVVADPQCIAHPDAA